MVGGPGEKRAHIVAGEPGQSPDDQIRSTSQRSVAPSGPRRAAPSRRFRLFLSVVQQGAYNDTVCRAAPLSKKAAGSNPFWEEFAC